VNEGSVEVKQAVAGQGNFEFKILEEKDLVGIFIMMPVEEQVIAEGDGIIEFLLKPDLMLMRVLEKGIHGKAVLGICGCCKEQAKNPG
jgi:hypothetical protein